MKPRTWLPGFLIPTEVTMRLICTRAGGYRGGAYGLNLKENDTFEVSDEEAARLLSEFPHWFKRVSRKDENIHHREHRGHRE
jgi:hypothetical protein